MNGEANWSSNVAKPSETQLVRGNREKTGKRNRQRMSVKERDAE